MIIYGTKYLLEDWWTYKPITDKLTSFLPDNAKPRMIKVRGAVGYRGRQLSIMEVCYGRCVEGIERSFVAQFKLSQKLDTVVKACSGIKLENTTENQRVSNVNG